MAFTPYIAASMAAPTVPEYSVSVPRLLPWFMPDTTRSGHSPISCMPSFAQSEGVPLIAYAVTSSSLSSVTRSALSPNSLHVKEWLAPLRCTLGAAMVTSCFSCRATASARMPAA